jgi:cyanophycin synthetase
MQIIDKTNYQSFTMSTRMMCEDLFERGWKIERIHSSSIALELTRLDGKKLLVIGSTPPSTSYMAHYVVKFKQLASEILKDILPPPVTKVFSDYANALEFAQSVWFDEKKIVVKPSDGAHGEGVTVGILTETELLSAWKSAKAVGKLVIVQEHTDNKFDTRVSVIGGKVVGALIRYPASVVGNGKQTLRELILDENKNPLRGENYSKSLNVINVDAAKRYLGVRLDEIPTHGERVQVVGAANLGTGGTTKDVTDQIPDWLEEKVLLMSQRLEIGVAAFDIMLKYEPEQNDSYEHLDPILLEVNRSPALFMHELPTEGKSRPAIKAFVDYLESL